MSNNFMMVASPRNVDNFGMFVTLPHGCPDYYYFNSTQNAWNSAVCDGFSIAHIDSRSFSLTGRKTQTDIHHWGVLDA